MEIFRALMEAVGFPLITVGLVVAAIVVVTHHFSKPKPKPKALDDCGEAFPCAHRAHNPAVNHPLS